mmetsp:Transcript_65468/g.77491  ORF Transcript_65468/g.77491 Transcript_65468/m.77491 type:complete len:254 (+) Transcript_65468:113-874(+)
MSSRGVFISLSILLIIIRVASTTPKKSEPTAPYSLGNFAYVARSPKTPPPTYHVRRIKILDSHLLTLLWNHKSHAISPSKKPNPNPNPHPRRKKILENIKHLIRLAIFTRYSRGAIKSIIEDTWEAERDPQLVFGQKVVSKNEQKIIRRRAAQARTLRMLVGAGYTPRLVWFFGVMLRGIIHCTALPRIFEPPIGWGAGSVLAARVAHREWLPCIMLGWYGSALYWSVLFGVDGPPDNDGFSGVPITIQGVTL